MNNIIKKELIYILMLAVMAVTSYVRNSVWKNEYTLWKDVTVKSGGKAAPHVNLGNALVRRGALEYAEREFSLALKVNPGDTRAVNGLAVIYVKKRLFDDAIRMFEILVADKPKEPSFQSNLGVVYMEKGMLDQAIMWFNKAIGVDPVFPDAHSNLGLAYKKKGMLKEAKQEFEKALYINPEHRDAGMNLTVVMRLLRERGTDQ